MNTEQLVSLFQSVNRGTVSLVDSLSVLSAVSELNNVKSEVDLHSGMLNVILENLDIESAALFLMQDDCLQLTTTASWELAHITTHYRKDDWKEFDVGLNESAVGKTAASRKIRYQKSQQLPGFFTQSVSKDDQKDVVGLRKQANALMYVPLTHQDIVLGVLCLHYSLNESVLTTLDQFMPLFSKFYVQTLMNFRYMNDLQGQVRERTQQLEDALHIAKEQHTSNVSSSLSESKTGLPNLRFFYKESLSALACAIRYKRPFSCCVIELKQGHDASIFEALSDILKMQVRESDILAHLRDKQFILSLPEIDAGDARLFAQRLLSVLEDLAKDVDIFDTLELQLGLASVTEDMGGSTESILDDLVAKAGQAMRLGLEHDMPICHIDDDLKPRLEVAGSS